MCIGKVQLYYAKINLTDWVINTYFGINYGYKSYVNSHTRHIRHKWKYVNNSNKNIKLISVKLPSLSFCDVKPLSKLVAFHCQGWIKNFGFIFNASSCRVTMVLLWLSVFIQVYRCYLHSEHGLLGNRHYIQ